MRDAPVIVYYFGNDPIGMILSNFAHTPFVLDGEQYASVEGFWQGLKTTDPELRRQMADLYGLDAKRAGQGLRVSPQLLVYDGKLYKVASEAHHRLLDRAIRAKVDQNQLVREALVESGNRRIIHMIANKYGQLRTGDSPALPAVVFERMLLAIRTELSEDRFIAQQPIPESL